MSIMMTADMREKLRKLSGDLGVSMSAYIVYALDTYITQKSVVDMADFIKRSEKYD